jgi:hypothetical protein
MFCYGLRCGARHSAPHRALCPEAWWNHKPIDPCLLDINRMSSNFLATLSSEIKVNFNMFLRAWNIGFAKRYVASILSHHNLAGEGLEIFNSFIRDCTQIISTVALVRDLYSTSVLDLDTVACFLTLQLTRFVPKNIAKPPIDRRSSMSPVQSA